MEKKTENQHISDFEGGGEKVTKISSSQKADLRHP